MTYYEDNRDKMTAYSFWMTILIVIYHLSPHILELGVYPSNDNVVSLYKNFFELFGSIALNYFFAASAYKFFISKKTNKTKLFKRVKTLLLSYIIWNTLYISLYIIQYGTINLKDVILGYTLTPFDGPMWYILVLYIFMVLLCRLFNQANNKVFKIMIIISCVSAAKFYLYVIKNIIDFPYSFWIERTYRMLPPFLTGMLLAKSKNSIFSKTRLTWVVSMLVILMCIILSTIIGDGAITILLMYICSFLMWIICPNFKLKYKSLMKKDMFSIYAIHERIIIITVAMIYKLQLVFEGVINVFIFLLLETMFIFVIGLVINYILKNNRNLDILLTGGRNERYN